MSEVRKTSVIDDKGLDVLLAEIFSIIDANYVRKETVEDIVGDLTGITEIKQQIEDLQTQLSTLDERVNDLEEDQPVTPPTPPTPPDDEQSFTIPGEASDKIRISEDGELIIESETSSEAELQSKYSFSINDDDNELYVSSETASEEELRSKYNFEFGIDTDGCLYVEEKSGDL